MHQDSNSQSNGGRLNRRRFVKSVAAAGAAVCSQGVLSSAVSGAGFPATAGRQRPEVAAIYCPLWHRYDHMDSWHGYGWNEWELVKSAPPRFKGHYQPLRPSWGCFDESNPEWSHREIDLAADNGIDVFMFDWYWYSGVRLMEEALERGFLKSPNNQRLKFALMWANHDWADYFPAPYDKPWNSWLPLRHSAADLNRVFDYCIEHYFREPNYWRVDGRLFFSIFQIDKFIRELGGPGGVKSLLESLDAKLERANLPPVHWNAIHSGPPEVMARWKEAGFHSIISSYNITDTGKTSANLTQEYEELLTTHRNVWASLSGGPLTHCPIVTMGWDVTPRCEHSVPWPFAKTNYPYGHIVVGNTPERFGRLCKLAAEHVAADPKQPFAVFINAWNEWTEGSYLLPEEKYGTAYLTAVKEAFQR
jgi:hypothetical protein